MFGKSVLRYSNLIRLSGIKLTGNPSPISALFTGFHDEETTMGQALAEEFGLYGGFGH